MKRAGVTLCVVAAVALGGFVLLERHQQGPPVTGMSNPRGIIEVAVGYTPAKMAALIERRDAAVRRCMLQAGFDWKPPPEDPQVWLSPHGLFGVVTPDAEDEFLQARGYGVVEQVAAIRAAHAQFQSTPDRSLHIADVEQTRYDRSQRACVAQANHRHGGVDPITGGALGRAYDRAMSDLRSTETYRRFEARVLACMRKHGDDVGELDRAAEPYIKRLIGLVGGSHRYDEMGRLIYEVGGPVAKRFRGSELEEIRRDELARAGRELGCRRRHQEPVIRRWADYSVPLVRQHKRQIDALREAMQKEGSR